MTMLPGQETLLASWQALTALSPGANVVRVGSTDAAVFPEWAPLNNAILLAPTIDLDTAAADAALVLADLYARAGVDTWALWIPSRAARPAAPDRLSQIAGMRRDTTTFVMRKKLSSAEWRDERVVPASIASVTRVGVDPMTRSDLGVPDDIAGLRGWAFVHDGDVVAGAWTYVHDSDCGIYAVETAAEWRRRGFASALMHHVLADAVTRGAVTATLQSTPMGLPLYRSVGFAPVGRYEEWVSG